MRIDANSALRMLICVAWLIAGGNSGPLVHAQASPDEKAARCKPCASIEKLVRKEKTPDGGDTPADVPPQSLREIEGLSQKGLEDVLENANACVNVGPTRIGEVTAKDKPYCGVQPGSVRELIQELETARTNIESAQRKQEQLSEALKSLAGLSALPGSRHDFPPQEVCSQCDALWKDIMAVVAFPNSGKSFVVRSVDNSRDAAKALVLTRQASEKLCTPWREIQNLPASAEKLNYYTWTPTWNAYQSLMHALETPALQAFCQ